jgi:hypothetical protein
MGAKNKVIAGDYAGCNVTKVMFADSVEIAGPSTLGVTLNKTNVASYELVTDEHKKSAASGIARGLVGGALLGLVGLLGGALSAKNKGIYSVAIEFKNGNRSLIEVDDKIYRILVKALF